jgi:hypothetical protein
MRFALLFENMMGNMITVISQKYRKESSMIKRNDLILIGVFIILGLGVIFFINATKSGGSELLITVNGEEYDTIPLNKDTTYTVKVDENDWNTFIVKDGVVDMIDASCPDKLCVNHSDIEYNHETIVCLPNRVVLEVIGGEESEVDAVAK